MKSLLASLCLIFASATYAADPQIGINDISNNVDTTALTSKTDFDARSKEILSIASENKFEENLVLINQLDGVSSSAYAYVDQSGGTGNLVAVIQDASVHSATAIVFQEGSNGRAIVHQH